MMPVDKYGRRFRTLRVSLVNHCNLGCVYCVTGDGDEASQHKTSMPAAQLLTMIARLHGALGLETVRLTGGEPLLYRDLTTLISGMHALGIANIRLTTNGLLLRRMAAPLRDAGLQSVNVSLDAIDEDVFFAMSRRHSVGRILDGIDAAIAAGMTVKINAVIMRGRNEGQILPLLEFAHTRGVRIRFLEVMAMGHLKHTASQHLFTQEEILSVIGSRYTLVEMGRAESATARYWRTNEGHCFGIIANESEPFCGDCDRLRLDSQGNIYGCLSSNHPIALDLNKDAADWSARLAEALAQKQALRFAGSDLSMLYIGG